jgi:hypothetical protein
MSTGTAPPAANLDELDAYDDGFTPQQFSNFRAGLETVADGDYEWTVLAATLERTSKQNVLIAKAELRVEKTAQVVEYAWLLDAQEKVDRFGGDMAVLGFPVGTWKGRLSQAIPEAIAGLPGRRFRGTKKTNPSKDPQRPFQNLYVNARLPDAAPGTVAAAGAGAPPGDGSSEADGQEIPF